MKTDLPDGWYHVVSGEATPGVLVEKTRTLFHHLIVELKKAQEVFEEYDV